MTQKGRPQRDHNNQTLLYLKICFSHNSFFQFGRITFEIPSYFNQSGVEDFSLVVAVTQTNSYVKALIRNMESSYKWAALYSRKFSCKIKFRYVLSHNFTQKFDMCLWKFSLDEANSSRDTLNSTSTQALLISLFVLSLVNISLVILNRCLRSR